jgi:hypothetical protein
MVSIPNEHVGMISQTLNNLPLTNPFSQSNVSHERRTVQTNEKMGYVDLYPFDADLIFPTVSKQLHDPLPKLSRIRLANNVSHFRKTSILLADKEGCMGLISQSLKTYPLTNPFSQSDVCT